MFRSAVPVYPVGLSHTLNTFIGFRVRLTPPANRPVTLTLTASSVYRLWVDGRFVGYGPARAGHGHYRVDVYDLTPHLRAVDAVVAIEVAGYNVNSYYLLDQPAFLQAEITTGDQVLASTAVEGDGEKTFAAYQLTHRQQVVQRYSFQRPFVEMYQQRPSAHDWRVRRSTTRIKLALEPRPAVALLPRGVPLPDFATRQPVVLLDTGRLQPAPATAPRWRDRSLTQIGPTLKGFPEAQLPLILSDLVQNVAIAERTEQNKPYRVDAPYRLNQAGYQLFDFGGNYSGFLRLTVRCDRRIRLVARFDEILVDHDIRQIDIANAVHWELSAGSHELECFEPYTLRYLKLYVVEGDCEILQVSLREYAGALASTAAFACSDDRLNQIYAAARETYRQNAVDVYTDCPHRERAGWMDNAYFMAPVELLLTGASRCERNYLENFLHYDPARDLPQLPKGMLPMCYPADHNDANYIPQWPLWFILQLEGYCQRTGDRALADAFKPRLLSLYQDYFKPYQNSDGLLEKLGGWRFVEWSKANELQDDVNYPTNMMYASALEAMGRLCGWTRFKRQARQLREAIREQSYDGEFFVDNALRKGGNLVPTGLHTEVCQYFAFAFDTATPESHPRLWRTLVRDFGPQRHLKGLYPNVYPANLINGIFLRLATMTRYGLARQVLRDLPGYFLHMAQTTGTLWEHTNTGASCNHGCTSHALNWIVQNVTGIHQIDPPQRTVYLAPARHPLAWYHVRIPVGSDVIEVDGRGPRRTLRLPAGWRIVPAVPQRVTEVPAHTTGNDPG